MNGVGFEMSDGTSDQNDPQVTPPPPAPVQDILFTVPFDWCIRRRNKN